MKKSIIFGSLLVLFVDQLSKYLVVTYLGKTTIEVIHNFFALCLTYNTGGAFSLLNKYPYIIVVVSIISLIFLREVERDIEYSKLKLLTFSLIYGGVIGNLIDRVFVGSVRDFLDFYVLGKHFPTFNLADVSIVVGICLLILFIWGRKESIYVGDAS